MKRLLVLLIFLLLQREGSCFANVHNRQTLKYGLFVNDSTTIIAWNNGYYAQEGVCVEYNQVTGSVQQFDGLLNGQYDLIITSVDNLLTRVVNLNQPLSLVATMDRQTGFVVVGNKRNGINNMEDLANKPLAIDAPNTGFVLALQKILEDEHIAYNKSTYQLIGGGPLRAQALERGWWVNPITKRNETVYGTILYGPEYYKIVSTDVIILADSREYFEPYQATAIMTTHAWLNSEKNRKTLLAFLIATERARRFLLVPQHESIVKRFWLEQPSPIATSKVDAFYDQMVNDQLGYNRDCLLEKDALLTTIDIREEQVPFNGTLNISKLTQSKKNGFWDGKICKKALKKIKV